MTDQRLIEIANRIEELTARLEATPVTPDGAVEGNAICAELDLLFIEAALHGFE